MKNISKSTSLSPSNEVLSTYVNSVLSTFNPNYEVFVERTFYSFDEAKTYATIKEGVSILCKTNEIGDDYYICKHQSNSALLDVDLLLIIQSYQLATFSPRSYEQLLKKVDLVNFNLFKVSPNATKGELKVYIPKSILKLTSVRKIEMDALPLVIVDVFTSRVVENSSVTWKNWIDSLNDLTDLHLNIYGRLERDAEMYLAPLTSKILNSIVISNKCRTRRYIVNNSKLIGNVTKSKSLICFKEFFHSLDVSNNSYIKELYVEGAGKYHYSFRECWLDINNMQHSLPRSLEVLHGVILNDAVENYLAINTSLKSLMIFVDYNDGEANIPDYLFLNRSVETLNINARCGFEKLKLPLVYASENIKNIIFNLVFTNDRRKEFAITFDSFDDLINIDEVIAYSLGGFYRTKSSVWKDFLHNAHLNGTRVVIKIENG